MPKKTPYSFEEDGIEPEKYRMMLGIDKDSFDDLVQYLIGKLNKSSYLLSTCHQLICFRNEEHKYKISSLSSGDVSFTIKKQHETGNHRPQLFDNSKSCEQNH